jgi:hypothetical protein
MGLAEQTARLLRRTDALYPDRSGGGLLRHCLGVRSGRETSEGASNLGQTSVDRLLAPEHLL